MVHECSWGPLSVGDAYFQCWRAFGVQLEAMGTYILIAVLLFFGGAALGAGAMNIWMSRVIQHEIEEMVVELSGTIDNLG